MRQYRLATANASWTSSARCCGERTPRGSSKSHATRVGGRKGKKGKRAFGETDATDCSKQPPAQCCHRLRRPRRHPCGAHPRFSRVRRQGPLARAKGRHFRFTYMGRAAFSASAPGPTAMAIVAASVSTRPTMLLPAVRSNSCRAADSVTRTRNWTRQCDPWCANQPILQHALPGVYRAVFAGTPIVE